MTPPDNLQLDIVTVAVVAISALAGGEVARYAGPYTVIIAAALTGSVIALMRRTESSRLQALAFVAWVTVLSVLLTGALAALAVHLLGRAGLQTEARFLLVPISAGIAAVGHDCPNVGTWLASVVKRVVGRRLGVGE